MTEQPMIRYRTDEPTEGERASTTEQIMNGLTWAILLICLGVWAIVGAIFWIPLLLRTMVRFSVDLVPSMLTGKHPTRAARLLRHAVTFYRRGFEVAIDAVTREPGREDRSTTEAEPSPLRGMALVNELAWVAVIWYGILLFFGVITATPIDVWLWLAGIQWNDAVFRPVGEFLVGLRS